MKSAGKCASKRSAFSKGAWCWAKGIEPESNHTSMTSGTRVIASPHRGRGNAPSPTAREGALVGVRAVGVGERDPRALLELGVGADAVDVALLAAPHGQRRAPVAL